jgi:hypothetical protein
MLIWSRKGNRGGSKIVGKISHAEQPNPAANQGAAPRNRWRRQARASAIAPTARPGEARATSIMAVVNGPLRMPMEDTPLWAPLLLVTHVVTFIVVVKHWRVAAA